MPFAEYASACYNSPVFKIGKVNLTSNILMAPMAGFTDIGFRALCRAGGAGLTYTEMVSMKGLKYNSVKTAALLITHASERPSAVQIFGCDPDIMSEMCLRPEISAFDIVDINMGCPVPKIVNNFEGSSLMRDPALAEKIIKAVRKNVKTLTVKFRKGFDEAHVNAAEFAKMCEGAGADAVTVHGRTREQYYGGASDTGIIAKVVSAVKIPVIGNGDVYLARGLTPERLMEETGCAAVMIARGALGRPYVFSKAYADFAAGRTAAYQKPSVYGMVSAHTDILLKYLPESVVVRNMRGHMAWYLKDIPGGKKLKAAINKMESVSDILEALKNI